MLPTYRYRAVLVRVIDGDTVEVDIDLGLFTWVRRQSLRLANVWADELDTAAGLALRDWLVEALPVGTQLVIETQKTRRHDDVRSFTRWVADLWVAGTEVHLNPWIQALIIEKAGLTP